ALSATGPKLSSETTTPVVASMPMPVSATRYRENWMLPPPSVIATPIVMAMATMAHTLDSRPEEVPERTVVAGPVRAASAISRTGSRSVDVKYSVRWLTTCASTRPTTTAPKHFQPSLSWLFPTYARQTTNVPTTV